MSSIYTEALLDHARQPKHLGMPAGRTIEGRWVNPLCGDSVVVGAEVRDGRFVAVGFEADACAVCVASASIMTELLEGTAVADFSEPQEALEAVLAGEPGERNPQFVAFSEVARYPSRRACVLLPWLALERAVIGKSQESAIQDPEPTAFVEASPWAVAHDIVARGDVAAIATLVSVEGSSPCVIGSRMVIASSGDFWGSVSGGCVESAVVQEAMELMASNPDEGRILDYQISNSQAGEVGLPCGGLIRVHVGMSPDLEELRARCEIDGPAVGVTALTGNVSVFATRGTRIWTQFPADVQTAVERGGAPGLVEVEDQLFFVESVEPPRRLVIVGATHIAQKLATLAVEVGLLPIVVDPRRSMASEERFAGAQLVIERPEDALPRLIDASTAVVMLSHDEKLDDPALRTALDSEAYHIAALGSRKTQRARIERLSAAGVSSAQLQRIHGPAGLAIGAMGAAEIALSILAEVVAAWRLRAVEPGRVAGIVLAAGSSTRAGASNKLLRAVDGAPMVQRVVDTATEAGLDPVFVVLGHDASAVKETLAGRPVQFVNNARHASGMGTSIATGIAALPDDIEAAVVLLGDMPLVVAADVRRLLGAYQPSTQHLIIAPEAGQGADRRVGNPVLWPRRYFAQLRELDADSGGKAIMQSAPGAVLRVPIDHDGVLRDFDT